MKLWVHVGWSRLIGIAERNVRVKTNKVDRGAEISSRECTYICRLIAMKMIALFCNTSRTYTSWNHSTASYDLIIPSL